jgi:hypothetical protein
MFVATEQELVAELSVALLSNVSVRLGVRCEGRTGLLGFVKCAAAVSSLVGISLNSF